MAKPKTKWPNPNPFPLKNANPERVPLRKPGLEKMPYEVAQ